jgi:putative DNA primase/helicase
VKCLGAALLAANQAISIDNCERELKSDFLCQMLTQTKMEIRVLGHSRNVECPLNAVIFATGNNLVIAGDATRRSLMSTMDASCERPELRAFTVDVTREAKERRGELVAAALTVLRAWHIARERMNLPAFGGFEGWSYRIREPLVWLDKTDPCETLAEIRDNDPYRAELIIVIEQWKANLAVDQKYTVQDVIGRALTVSDFYNALSAVALARAGGTVSNDRLGRWLKRVQGKIVNGLTLLKDGSRHGYPLWKLTRR